MQSKDEMNIESVVKGLLEKYPIDSNEFDHAIYTRELEKVEKGQCTGVTSSSSSLFTKNVIPSILMILKAGMRYSSLRTVCISIVSNVIIFNQMQLLDELLVETLPSILYELTVNEEKRGVRVKIGGLLSYLTGGILQAKEQYTNSRFAKLLIAYYSMNSDEIVSDLNINISGDTIHYLDQWVVQPVIQFLNEYDEKGRVSTSHKELCLYIRGLTKILSIDQRLTALVVTDKSSVAALLLSSNILHQDSSEVNECLSQLYHELNRHASIMQILNETLSSSSSVDDLSYKVPVLRIAILTLTCCTVDTYDATFSIIFNKLIPYHDIEQDKLDQYHKLMDALLDILLYMKPDDTHEMDHYFDAILVLLIFCSKTPLSTDSVRRKAEDLMKHLAPDTNLVLAKNLTVFAEHLERIFKDKRDVVSIEPLWKVNCWAKYVLEYVVPRVQKPYFNGQVLQIVLPMVLKLADDSTPEYTSIGINALQHLLKEASPSQITGFGAYIFPVLRNAIGNRQSTELWPTSLQTINLFLMLHKEYEPSDTKCVVYQKNTPFIEEAIDQYLFVMDYADSNEQKEILVKYFLQLLPVVSVAILKDFRRITKNLFGREYLGESDDYEKPSSLIDICLDACHFLFTLAWPILQSPMYNNEERQHIQQVLSKLNTDKANHLLSLVVVPPADL